MADTAKQVLVEVDARGRVSLGRLTKHRRFLVEDLGGGAIALHPVFEEVQPGEEVRVLFGLDLVPAVVLEQSGDRVRVKILMNEGGDEIFTTYSASEVRPRA